MAFGPLAPLRADPGAGAVLLDVDGTLAPIAPHPDQSAVPDATRALEARPPVAVGKGTAVRDLLASSPAARSLYAGDDLTDLDALRVVDVGVAVRSDETPPVVLKAAAIVVEGPVALADLLAGLAVDSA